MPFLHNPALEDITIWMFYDACAQKWEEILHVYNLIFKLYGNNAQLSIFSGKSYFEVTLLETSHKTFPGVGVCSASCPTDSLVGYRVTWLQNIALYLHKGHVLFGQGECFRWYSCLTFNLSMTYRVMLSNKK